MLPMIEITDEDIVRTERHWEQTLSKRVVFSEEHRNVLKHWGSCDVQACPGSGKTLTLTSKLLVLLDKMPPKAGLLVLSHTNAACDEIVERLGLKGQALLKRPHFIGTLQHFVNQFLAIPAMMERYGTRPWAIEDSTFSNMVSKHLSTLPYRAKTYFERQGQGDPMQVLQTLRYSFSDENTLVKWGDGKEHAMPCGETTDSYRAALTLKHLITREGCLAYHDAFSLGMAYLRAHPALKPVFAQRFPVVFIDEMQDTSPFQNQVLRALFDGVAHVVRFGDVNQQIFEKSGREHQWIPQENHLRLNQTLRMSPSISHLCAPLALEPQDLRSASTEGALRHTFFLFSDPGDVLPAYAKLIQQEFPSHFQVVAKAVGQTGLRKDRPGQEKLCIKRYHDGFQRRGAASRHKQVFAEHMEEFRRILIDEQSTGKALDVAWDALARLCREQGFRRADGKPHSPYSLNLHVKRLGKTTEKRIRKILQGWMSRVVTGLDFNPEIWERDCSSIMEILGVTALSRKSRAFLQGAPTAPTDPVSTLQENQVEIMIGGHPVQIHMDTIHGVKGQTYHASLLLETHMKKDDVTSILGFFFGERPRKPLVVQQNNAKLAYVALSRATHLVCVAVQKSSVDGEARAKLEAQGWHVEELL